MHQFNRTRVLLCFFFFSQQCRKRDIRFLQSGTQCPLSTTTFHVFFPVILGVCICLFHGERVERLLIIFFFWECWLLARWWFNDFSSVIINSSLLWFIVFVFHVFVVVTIVILHRVHNYSHRCCKRRRRRWRGGGGGGAIRVPLSWRSTYYLQTIHLESLTRCTAVYPCTQLPQMRNE